LLDLLSINRLKDSTRASLQQALRQRDSQRVTICRATAYVITNNFITIRTGYQAAQPQLAAAVNGVTTDRHLAPTVQTPHYSSFSGELFSGRGVVKGDQEVSRGLVVRPTFDTDSTLAAG